MFEEDASQHRLLKNRSQTSALQNATAVNSSTAAAKKVAKGDLIRVNTQIWRYPPDGGNPKKVSAIARSLVFLFLYQTRDIGIEK